MDALEIRDYLLGLPMVEEAEPFEDTDAVVYKVGGKWFAVYIFQRPEYLAVKCSPDRAVLLRDEFAAITPAWHFNKRHWNDLCFGMLPDEVVKREICHSYLTVIKKNISPKSLREQYLKAAADAGIEDAGIEE
ncbi:MAG: MmcQ/YjbR family DNA-binding protein [Clostridium sp.]|nr:MmcQ/YjbR family DNA-binding protein [Bacteroides sp.]MCM1197398.1 MmcQ/YjbR family DNA-binding protein [Clostridium sp.]